jgi:hypothetical protein
MPVAQEPVVPLSVGVAAAHPMAELAAARTVVLVEHPEPVALVLLQVLAATAATDKLHFCTLRIKRGTSMFFIFGFMLGLAAGYFLPQVLPNLKKKKK